MQTMRMKVLQQPRVYTSEKSISGSRAENAMIKFTSRNRRRPSSTLVTRHTHSLLAPFPTSCSYRNRRPESVRLRFQSVRLINASLKEWNENKPFPPAHTKLCNSPPASVRSLSPENSTAPLYSSLRTRSASTRRIQRTRPAVVDRSVRSSRQTIRLEVVDGNYCDRLS